MVPPRQQAPRLAAVRYNVGARVSFVSGPVRCPNSGRAFCCPDHAALPPLPSRRSMESAGHNKRRFGPFMGLMP